MNRDSAPAGSDQRGLAAAVVLAALWLATLGLGIAAAADPGSAPLWVTLLTWATLIPLRGFLYVGLFITAHDAMHGVVAPGTRWNDRIGRITLTAFGLPYDAMRAHHLAHHATPAGAADPDWNADQRWLPWLFAFVRRYIDARVVAKNGMIVCAIAWVAWSAGAPPATAFALHVVPVFLAVLQLFTFGTWLPHRAHGAALDVVHRARSSDRPRWRSFLACYHFGYHLEHHRSPHVPWWGLPALRWRARPDARQSVS